MNDSPLCEDFWAPAPPRRARLPKTRRGAVIVYDPDASVYSSQAVRWTGGYYVQMFEEATEFSSPQRKGPPSTTFLCRKVAEAWALNRGAKELIYR